MARRRGAAWVVVCAIAVGCGGTAASSSAPPSTQRVSDQAAKRLLRRAFHAARRIGHEDGLCRGCYPDDAGEITEELNGVTGDEYGAAATPFGAKLGGVVYLDTSGEGRLERDRFTAYARTSNGTVWMLTAGRGRPRLAIAE